MAKKTEEVDVWKLIDDIGVSFLLTRKGQTFDARVLQARPDKDEGLIYFMTDRDNDGPRQIEADPRVFMTFADKGRNDYATVEGEAMVSNDRAKIRELWTHWSQAFWKGSDDPRICLIVVRPDKAHYWQSPNAAATTVALLAGAVTGKQPDLGTEGVTRL